MQEEETIDVLYEAKDLIAVYKRKGIPTVPLKKSSEGDSLLGRVGRIYPEVLLVKGLNPWEGGTIHRLDTPTSGIVILARNDEAYNRLISLQKKDMIKKRYIASLSEKRELMEGFEKCPYSVTNGECFVTSYFRSYGPKGAQVRPVLQNKRYIKGEKYTTHVAKNGKMAECVIYRGFRHQIRCHLAWLGKPIVGDSTYGGEESEELLLEAVEVSFPFNGRELDIKI